MAAVEIPNREAPSAEWLATRGFGSLRQYERWLSRRINLNCARRANAGVSKKFRPRSWR